MTPFVYCPNLKKFNALVYPLRDNFDEDSSRFVHAFLSGGFSNYRLLEKVRILISEIVTSMKGVAELKCGSRLRPKFEPEWQIVWNIMKMSLDVCHGCHGLFFVTKLDLSRIDYGWHARVKLFWSFRSGRFVNKSFDLFTNRPEHTWIRTWVKSLNSDSLSNTLRKLHEIAKI